MKKRTRSIDEKMLILERILDRKGLKKGVNYVLPGGREFIALKYYVQQLYPKMRIAPS